MCAVPNNLINPHGDEENAKESYYVPTNLFLFLSSESYSTV